MPLDFSDLVPTRPASSGASRGAAAPGVVEVTGPDGTIFEFPAGTPQATMSAAVRKHYAGAQPAAAPQQDGPWTKYQAAPAGQPANGGQKSWERYQAQSGTSAVTDPWADFRVSAPAASGQQTLPSLQATVSFDDLIPAQRPVAPSKMLDVAASLPAGAARGAAETAMLPVTASRVGRSADEWLFDQGDSLVRSIVGAEPFDPAERAQQRAAYETPLTSALSAGQDKAREGMDAVLYKPRTTPGKYAETVGEFLAPGGVPSRATRAAPTAARMAGEYAADVTRHAVLPGVVSEAAGQATEGTAYEPYARAAGALAANVSGAAGKAAVAPEMIVRPALGHEPIDWERAVGLQDNATGIRLTGPESITQAQNGASALPDLLRVIEGSVEGRAGTAPFFARRPGQVDAAVQEALDRIGPASATPSVLGPRAAEAATEVLDGARRDINARTRPLYQAAEPQQLPAADFPPIQADPRFQSALARLRNDPDLAPDYARYPDDSVAVVDAVTKDMAARGEALASRANPLYGPELAGKNAAGARDARSAARTAVPEYDQALATQARARRDELQPLEAGPLGRIAAAGNTRGAGEALLPAQPLTGSGGEARDAARRLLAQDPGTTRGLVRQNLADRYADAATETQAGNREFAGAKFRTDVAGSQPKREVLDAVLEAIDRPEARAAMPELLDVLQATGRRKPIGSATAFNNSVIGDMGAGNALTQLGGVAKSLGTSLFTIAGDAVKRATYRNSVSALADMFTSPDAVQRMRRAAETGAPVVMPEASARALAQLLPLFVGNGPQRSNSAGGR